MLPEQDWLDKAKRLAIGMRVRVRHRHESRPNMVIANEKDKFWAYCQKCKEGAVVQKEHVLFGTSVTKADSSPPGTCFSPPMRFRPVARSCPIP